MAAYAEMSWARQFQWSFRSFIATPKTVTEKSRLLNVLINKYLNTLLSASIVILDYSIKFAGKMII